MARERKLIEDGVNSFWAASVEYLEASTGGGGQRFPGGRGKVDYREILKPEEFAVYAQLREVRKTLASAEGVPVYAVFTNEHLAEMVRKRMKTKAELQKIEGIVRSFRGLQQRGLPIGRMMSQHFANFYLSWFDRTVTDAWRVLKSSCVSSSASAQHLRAWLAARIAAAKMTPVAIVTEPRVG